MEECPVRTIIQGQEWRQVNWTLCCPLSQLWDNSACLPIIIYSCSVGWGYLRKSAGFYSELRENELELRVAVTPVGSKEPELHLPSCEQYD